jgi:anti-sigma factor RsiW
VQELIHGYVDSELDVRETAELERHIHGCKTCEGVYQNQITLRSALKDQSLYFHAPEDLRKRVRTSLQIASRGESTQPRFRWGWSLMAASLALFILATSVWKFAPLFRNPANDELLAHEILSDHIRSLQMSNHLTDVLSTDQHTVKPWFNGKIDFSPPVRDFASQDFHLFGGRVGYLNNRTVATLVYQRHGHYINLYIWPLETGGAKKESSRQLQGYNLIQWTNSGMAFWAVSDLNTVELNDFVRYVQQPQ